MAAGLQYTETIFIYSNSFFVEFMYFYISVLLYIVSTSATHCGIVWIKQQQRKIGKENIRMRMEIEQRSATIN